MITFKRNFYNINLIVEVLFCNKFSYTFIRLKKSKKKFKISSTNFSEHYLYEY